MAECCEIMKVVDGCKEKTYGVRDEYRVSGYAARIMLDNVEDKVGVTDTIHYIIIVA